MSWLRSPMFRQALLIAVVPLLLAIVGVLVVQAQLKARLLVETEQRLQAELQNFAALYDQRRIPAVRQAMEFRSLQHGDEGRIYLLQARDGTWLGGNIQEWPANVDRAAEGFETGPAQQITYAAAGTMPQPYLAAGRTLRGGFPLLVGVSLTPMVETLGAMRARFLGFGAVMLLAGLALAILGASRARKRLGGINQFLDRVGTGDGLQNRLPVPTPAAHDEFAQLNSHINAMMDRITHLFAAHKRLGDAVAHEMRTPLARIQNRLAELEIDETNRAQLEEEIRATIRLFDSLLNIAQMDAEIGNRAGLSPLNLSEICTQIVELYSPVAEEGGRDLIAQIDPDAQILGDSNLMAQLVSNLVENGLKYTRPGDAVHVTLTRGTTRVVLRISDTGPGLDPAVRDKVFAPFVRGPTTSDQPGHGLGLSLVRAITLRHGAILRMPETEIGFALEIDCLHLEADSAR